MRIVEHGVMGWVRGAGWPLGVILALAQAVSALGQTPELDALKKVAGVGAPAPIEASEGEPKGKLDEIVAETSGPISVTDTVNDAHMLKKLHELLPKYPGVRRVDVEVENGVVTLAGQVRDDEVRDRLRDFVRRVEGVYLVINQTRTDAEVFTASQRAKAEIKRIADRISRGWLLWLLATVIAIGSIYLARLFSRYGETILTPFAGNSLLRSVLVSVVSAMLAVGGLLGALSIMGLTETVLPGLGLAGVVALAIGFAFRDITENFIASILLGTRRPFRLGDYVEISKYAGVVRTLNTRATVLVTQEGNQVRIPNSIMFKEVLINKSASTSVRNMFDVVIPYEASVSAAQEAIARSIQGKDGVLVDPPARVLVEALETDGVRLRVYYWAPTRGVDGLKLLSDAKLKAKVALQELGVTPSPRVIATVAGGSAAGDHRAGALSVGTGLGIGLGGGGSSAASATPAAQAQANLRRDQYAAAHAEATGPACDQDHALRAAREELVSEGQNLIHDEEARDDEEEEESKQGGDSPGKAEQSPPKPAAP